MQDESVVDSLTFCCAKSNFSRATNNEAETRTGLYPDAIKNLQPGITEMIVHLAYDDEEMKGVAFDHPNWGSAWRQRDFQCVTSDAFRSLLRENNVKLITWREVNKLMKK
ncbi:MAG TPA: ChbG/HpnK family deacetylase [Pyrinomonadaceae bacterium]|jgi:hypothetical protein|nr:ChbG/HpnK family deacetylase [Pyrinomonadaceae bacterium]